MCSTNGRNEFKVQNYSEKPWIEEPPTGNKIDRRCGVQGEEEQTCQTIHTGGGCCWIREWAAGSKKKKKWGIMKYINKLACQASNALSHSWVTYSYTTCMSNGKYRGDLTNELDERTRRAFRCIRSELIYFILRIKRLLSGRRERLNYWYEPRAPGREVHDPIIPAALSALKLWSQGGPGHDDADDSERPITFLAPVWWACLWALLEMSWDPKRKTVSVFGIVAQESVPPPNPFNLGATHGII